MDPARAFGWLWLIVFMPFAALVFSAATVFTPSLSWEYWDEVTFGSVLLVELLFLAYLVWGQLRRARRLRRGVWLLVDEQGMSVAAGAQLTRIPWSEVEWVAARVGVPPTRGHLSLVARPAAGATKPPRRRTLLLKSSNDFDPRWYGRRRVLQVCDLTYLEAPIPVVLPILERLAGDKWRHGRTFDRGDR